VVVEHGATGARSAMVDRSGEIPKFVARHGWFATGSLTGARYRAPNLGPSMHHVSVPRSVADTHNSNKIDINHTFIAKGKTHYMV
jgi:hypothetical protein